MEDWIRCKLDELITAGLRERDVIDAVKESEAARIEICAIEAGTAVK